MGGRLLGGRYRLGEAIGTGGSGTVYLADDLSLGRQVAVKVLHSSLVGDEAFVERFRREARLVASLAAKYGKPAKKKKKVPLCLSVDLHHNSDTQYPLSKMMKSAPMSSWSRCCR